MSKNPNFGPDFDPNVVPKKTFSWVLPLLDVIPCCKLSLYVISRITKEPNLKMAKNLVLAPLAQIRAPKIIFVDFTSTRC